MKDKNREFSNFFFFFNFLLSNIFYYYYFISMSTGELSFILLSLGSTSLSSFLIEPKEKDEE